MFENGPLVTCRYINNLYSICIHVNCLIANQQLLETFLFILYQRNVSITDVKLVVVLEEELEVFWVLVTEFNQVDSQLLLILIYQHIKRIIIFIVNNLANHFYVKCMV